MRRIVGIAVLMVAALLAAAGFVRQAQAQKRIAFVAAPISTTIRQDAAAAARRQ